MCCALKLLLSCVIVSLLNGATATQTRADTPGFELPEGTFPGVMRIDDEETQPVALEIVEARPGQFLAKLIDDSGRSIKLVGRMTSEGRFVASGFNDCDTVRMTGDIMFDASGQPTAVEGNFTIEDRFGKPVANGIIAILIGLFAPEKPGPL